MIEISKGVYIVDVKKFTDIYNARLNATSVLSEGCIERMEQLKKVQHGRFLKSI